MSSIEVKVSGFTVDAEPEETWPSELVDVADEIKTKVGMALSEIGDCTHGSVEITFGDNQVQV